MKTIPIHRDPLRSNETNSVAARKRPDLVIAHTRHKYDSAVVVKDPVAMKYHRMRPDEYFVLERLRPGATLQSLQRDYQREYAPEKVTLAELNALLFRFHSLGLTLSDSPEQGDRLLEKRRTDQNKRLTQHLSSVLFIRFPGVDPEPLLRKLYPVVRPLLSRVGLAMIAMTCLAALFTLASNWPRFLSEFPAMHQWIQLRAVLILAAVIGGTKILHEIGHAVVCKHFGSECHQIGPMLLVFTPALYCDTSDSWTLSNRFARAAVGMAGIGTEILLASLATLVWASTGPSLVHYLAMNIMVVCSVSTLLFNANPLLRYDGYYVLADLCDVPNLAPKSRGVLSRLAGRWFLGIKTDEDQSIGKRERFWLVIYALAALVYRWTLTLLILWFILLILRPYRLESVGWTLCLFAAGGLLLTTLRGPISFLRHPGQKRLIRMDRALKTGAVLAILIVTASLPLPWGESAEGRIVPHQEIPIYVATAGHLDQIQTLAGTNVQKDDPIARLVNPNVEFLFIKAQSRVSKQQELVDALSSSQLTLPDAANELPVAEAILVEFRRQLKTRQTRRDALLIRAPASGRLIAPPRRTTDVATMSDLRLASWNGDPTEPRNRGCFVQSGTELFTIITGDQWDAELVVSASQAQRIEIGNAVKLVIESHPSTPIHGRVSKISSKQWSIQENSDRRDDQQAIRQSTPVETSYAVRVHLNLSDAQRINEMVTGAEVAARISAEPISLFGRAARFANRLLRFR